MRQLVAITLTSLAAAACGTAPGEPAGTTSQELINLHPPETTCSQGYQYECQDLDGHDPCGCVMRPCNWVVPPPPTTYATWVEAWAVQTPDGLCPEIVTPTGTWAEFGSLQGPASGPPYYFDGVPNEPDNCFGPVTVNPSQTCESKFDGGSCCTYVWWPSGYPSAPASSWPEQDSQALCTEPNLTLVALEQPTQTGLCPRPGSGTCPTCNQVSFPVP